MVHVHYHFALTFQRQAIGAWNGPGFAHRRNLFMTFRLRIMLMVAGALVLAFIGLGYASFALLATQHNTSQFVDRDLKTLQTLDDM